jgi:hypothetical protein
MVTVYDTFCCPCRTWNLPLDFPRSCNASGVCDSDDRGPWLLLSRLMGGLVVGGDRQSLLLPLLAPAPASEALLKPAADTTHMT